MSYTLQIVKKLKRMGFSIKQVLQTIELPESAVLQAFAVKNAIVKYAGWVSGYGKVIILQSGKYDI
ncbi:hypothetical protein ACAG39_05055 [Caldicellulosiruptoraceae bacterium PP1]